MTWETRPILRFNLENPCVIGRLALWMTLHLRITSTVAFVCFLVAFGLLLAR